MEPKKICNIWRDFYFILYFFMVKPTFEKIIFLNFFFLFLVLFRFQMNHKIVFSSPKVPRNENILRKMIFLMFGCQRKSNIHKNILNLSILKLFDLYNDK